MSNDFIKFFGGMGAFLVCLFIVMNAYSKHTCAEYGEVSSLPTKHFGLSVCMIEDPQLGWMTYSERSIARTAERGLTQ